MSVRRRLTLALAAMLALAALALTVHSAVELGRFERADVRRTTLVYAGRQALAPGTHIERIGLAATLARLGYAETRGAPASPGQFRRQADAWDIHLRGLQATGESPRRLRVETANDRITRVTRDGRDVADAALEPEVLTSAADRAVEDHRPVRLTETPRTLIDAVLAAEDHRFFNHGGVDLRAVARAAWRNLRAGQVVQGGSSLTQQLVKMRLLSPRRTLWRKIQEAWLAELVEWRYSKERILEAYLNEIYLGQRGTVAIRGVGAATRAYFGKEVHQLSLGEAALLAGVIRAPNSSSPAVNAARARERRDAVLGRMRELGMIGEADYQRAGREPVETRWSAPTGQIAPYFVDEIRQELEQRYGPDVIRHRGVQIFTTLDPTLQRLAEQVTARGLDRLETELPRLRRRDPAQRLQVALLAVEPGRGRIRALVGGRDYQASQFNRVTLARRQPGSAFKPFVYLAALRAGPGGPRFTAASRVDDAPITLEVDGRSWSPRNYEDRYAGRVSVRRALELSLNAATVRVAQAAGLDAVVETARALGFRPRLAPLPAMALGAFEATPADLARAYLPLANGGWRLPGPVGIQAVLDRDAELQRIGVEEPAQAISPAEAYLMTSLLQGVIASGTGSAARELGGAKAAGKTGTTNDGRDAWFVGYTPGLLTVVWVGFDDGEPHGLSGGQAALPIWADFMRQALDVYPQPDFVVPAGIEFADVDATNGKLARLACPLVVHEAFLAGTKPEPCDEHSGVADRVADWWRRVKDWFGR